MNRFFRSIYHRILFIPIFTSTALLGCIVQARTCSVSDEMLSEDDKLFINLLNGPIPPARATPKSRFEPKVKGYNNLFMALVADSLPLNLDRVRILFRDFGGHVHQGPALSVNKRNFDERGRELVNSYLANIQTQAKFGRYDRVLILPISDYSDNFSVNLTTIYNKYSCKILQYRPKNIEFTVIYTRASNLTSCTVKGIYSHYGILNLELLESEIRKKKNKNLDFQNGSHFLKFLNYLYGSYDSTAVNLSDECQLRRSLVERRKQPE